MLPLVLAAAFAACIEYVSHLTVALWRAVAVVHARGLIVTRTGTDPRGETFQEGNVAAVGPTSAMICCAESTPKPGTSASR